MASAANNVGGEFKPEGAFSKRQLDMYKKGLQLNNGTTARNSKIACREHSGEPPKELQCEGPCGKWRPLNQFSKNARGKGKTWCVDCTEWQLYLEPYVKVIANPNGKWSADELVKREKERVGVASTEDDMIGTVDDETTSLLRHGSAEGLAVDSARVKAAGAAGLSIMPPHLQYLSGEPRAPHHYLPHLGGPSSATHHASSAPSADTYSTAVAVAKKGKQPAFKYNAFGPTGQMDTRHATGTEKSETMSTTSSLMAQQGRDLGRSGWARPSQRKTALVKPYYYFVEGNAEPEDNGSSDDGFDSPDEC